MSQGVTWRASVGEGLEVFRARAATTPGRLRLLSIILVVGTALVWLLAAAAIIGARAEVDLVGQRSVPQAIAAQRMHAALSDADRLAANDFLLGATGSSEPRQEYLLDITTATQQLEKISELNGAGGPMSTQLQDIASLLTQYTGLVETARANARVGYPVGSAYLRRASDLMHRPRDGILVRVDALDTLGPNRLATDQTTLWILLGTTAAFFAAGLALLVLLASTQRFLRRRFRRRRSYQLLAAGTLTAVLLVSIAAQALTTYRNLALTETDSYPRLHNLWHIRSLAADANADQSLSLITRGDDPTYDNAFKAATQQLLDRPLTDALADAATRGTVGFQGMIADQITRFDSEEQHDAALKLLRGYQEFMANDAAIKAKSAAGDYDGAAALVVGATATGTAFADVNIAAQQRIDVEQARFEAQTAAARPSLILDVWVVIVAITIAVLVLWGVQPRIAEYRA